MKQNMFMSFKIFKAYKKHVGDKGIEVVSFQVREEALKEELQLTKKTYSTEKYGMKPALSVSLDMGWQKRSSGRRFDSPSGVLHCIGGHTKKIL